MRPIIDIKMFHFTLTVISSSRTKSLQRAGSRISTLVHIYICMYYYKLCFHRYSSIYSDSGRYLDIYPAGSWSLSQHRHYHSWMDHISHGRSTHWLFYFHFYWPINLQTHTDSCVGGPSSGFPNRWMDFSGVWDLALRRRVGRQWLGRGEIQEAGLWWQVYEGIYPRKPHYTWRQNQTYCWRFGRHQSPLQRFFPAYASGVISCIHTWWVEFALADLITLKP